MLDQASAFILLYMTDTDMSSVDKARSDAAHHQIAPDSAVHRKPRGRGSTIALVVLAVCVVIALYIAWERWGRLDPDLGSQAREIAHIKLSPAEHPWYFPMLFLHILAASVALATSVFQVWPWLRRRFPQVHRNVGRVYIFGGVYPAVFFGLVVQVFWAFSVPTAISQIVPLALWTAVTTCGLVQRRRGRIVEHRRWMLRSFALTALVLIELAIDPFVQLLVRTELHTRLGGNMDIYMQMKDTTENWLGLTIAIISVEWWLERERHRPSATAVEAAAIDGAGTA